MTSTSTAPARAGAPQAALAALSLSMLLASLAASSATVALPSLTSALGASFEQVQWIVLAYLLASTALIVGAGRLGDIAGRKRLLLVGLALYAMASLAAAMAPTLAALIGARALQGAGAAIMMTLSVALVGEVVTRDKMGSAVGFMGAMSAIGTALGPSLGGAILSIAGWRALFLIGAPLSAAAITLAALSLPSDRRHEAKSPPFDVAGAIVLASALTAYTLAMSAGHGATATKICLLPVALAGLGFFAFVETRAHSPLISLQLLRDRALATGLSTSMTVAAVLMTTLVVGPFYLARGLGFDAASVGLAMSVGPMVAALVAAPAGRLADRFGAERAMRAGLVGITTGCGLLATTAQLGALAYLASIAVLTSSYALFQAANNTAVIACARPDQRGVISALLGLSRNLGLLTGASAMGAVFALALGPSGVLEASAGSVIVATRAAFGAALGLALLALVIAAVREPQAAR